MCEILCDKCGQPWGDGGSIDIRINHRMCSACTEEWRKETDKADAKEAMPPFGLEKYEILPVMRMMNQVVDEINALKRRVRQLEGR